VTVADKATPDAGAVADEPHIVVETNDGIRYSVPARLNCITTYILLEQECWFEKEAGFVARLACEGMIAIDVGANVGVYSLPLARAVGATGHVFAYEPSRVNRSHLERSLALNGAINTTLRAAALSDRDGRGQLELRYSGELHCLSEAPGADASVEEVAIASLDSEMSRLNWSRLDFLKLDAEGQEQAIIAGGEGFFATFSPLVMFEINHATVANLSLADILRRKGFDIFRLLGDASMLVPFDPKLEVDHFEVNLFAARPERAIQLEERGLLARSGGNPILSPAERARCVEAFCLRPYTQGMQISASDLAACPFGNALLAYCAYRMPDAFASDRRLALLEAAYEGLAGFCATSSSPAALVSLARVALDSGRRKIAQDVLRQLLAAGPQALDQPFLPPAARYESLDTPSAEEWLAHSIAETLELGDGYSSLFVRELPRLQALADNAIAAPEIIRRLVQGHLIEARPLNAIESRLGLPNGADPVRHDTWRNAMFRLAQEH
jgi:FkbM family methyltransferase